MYTCRFYIRISKEDAEHLKRTAQILGITRSALLRLGWQCCQVGQISPEDLNSKKRIFILDTKTYQGYLRELNHQGNNLNQIAHALNILKTNYKEKSNLVVVEAIDEYTIQLSKIEKELKKIKTSLVRLEGDYFVKTEKPLQVVTQSEVI